MAKKSIDDTIKTLDELRSKFLLVKDDFSQFYGVKDIYDAVTFPSDPDNIYLYFVGNDNQIKDRLTYEFSSDSSPVIRGDHVVKGRNLDDIYRDLEFCTVSFIMGCIYDSRFR